MERDVDRLERVVAALQDGGFDALVCALPANVLLLSGYWPVIGSAIAVVTREGRVALLAPADERDLAESGWADDLRTFQPGGLTELVDVPTAAAEPFAALLRAAGLGGVKARVAFEGGGAMEPASYVSLHVYGGAMRTLLENAMRGVQLADGSELIARLRAVKTRREIACIARSCSVAERAFSAGATHVMANASERAIAAAFAAGLEVEARGEERSGGFVFCMSGPDAARAGKAYARSGAREMEQGEVALVHCNSHVGGYWTDITRCYCAGAPDAPAQDVYDAVFEARAAALDALRPGARARDVDRAARTVLERRGYGRAFTHGTGHGVGFAAINHNAMPRVHPASPDILEPGMVFNIEPAVYLDGVTGIRHCDVVALGDRGATLLTPFHTSIGELARA
ncbi:MAG TPA: Xaa-Pro peptidase family protein [Gemmatimonadaceae bacterium]|nr:Xaa-Pro peptidase family protein [Gemmatimonadaceae bacterium]